MKLVHIPLDLESRPQFRALEQRIGKVKALAAVWILFRELGYYAGEAEAAGLGVLKGGAERELLKGSLQEICALEDLEGSVLVRQGAIRTGEGANLTGEQSAEWCCPLFAADNRHLARDHVSMASKGGHARAVSLRAREAAAAAVHQEQVMQPEMFAIATAGTEREMTPEERKRALMLIRLLDNVLGRKARLTSEYSAGLIADSHRVAGDRGQDQINEVCTYLMSQRANVDKTGVGRVPETERVLREWEDYERAAVPA